MKRFNREEAEQLLKEKPDVWGVIRLITEADYGCEELPAGQKERDRVVIVTREGEKVVEVEDQLLLTKNLDEGSCITNEWKELFLRK